MIPQHKVNQISECATKLKYALFPWCLAFFFSFFIAAADFLLIWFQLPQQENLFDCGLFLLHYVELFLEQAPVNFSPAGITESSKFVSYHLEPLDLNLFCRRFHCPCAYASGVAL